MAKINGNNILSVVRTLYLSETDHDLVARYNLGIADSVSESGGITTITRKTGYIDLGTIDWSLQNFGTGKIFAGILPIEHKAVDWSQVANLLCSKYQAQTYLQSYGGSQGISTYTSTNTTTIIINDTNFNDGISLKNSLQGVYLQYELIDSLAYTEKVPTNRPLNTLDQQGSQWLRKEWEKGLNLINVTGETISGDSIKSYSVKLLANNKYTLKLYNATGNSTLALALVYTDDTTSSDVAVFNVSSSGTFTPSKDVKQIRVYSSATITNANFMLNEGDHAYPYQEYRGEIVRAGIVKFVFSLDDVNPPATYGTWELFGEMYSPQGGTIYLWERLDV